MPDPASAEAAVAEVSAEPDALGRSGDTRLAAWAECGHVPALR